MIVILIKFKYIYINLQIIVVLYHMNIINIIAVGCNIT